MCHRASRMRKFSSFCGLKVTPYSVYLNPRLILQIAIRPLFFPVGRNFLAYIPAVRQTTRAERLRPVMQGVLRLKWPLGAVERGRKASNLMPGHQGYCDPVEGASYY